MPSPKKNCDLTGRFELAKRLAQSAGKLATELRSQNGRSGLEITAKGPQDFVTFADGQVERFIRDSVKKDFPDDGFLGEETGGSTTGKAIWVVDPIDGTANYMRGFPYWCVSIALVVNNQVIAGVVYDASRQWVYSAFVGHGAYVDGAILRANAHSDPQTSLAILGYVRDTALKEHLGLISAVHSAGMDMKNLGSAALDLVQVAEGKAELAAFHLLYPWDVLAGLLIAVEAGAVGYCLPIEGFLQGRGPVICGSVETASVAKEFFSTQGQELQQF